MFQIYDYQEYQWQDVDVGKSNLAIVIISIILGILFILIILLLICRFLNKKDNIFKEVINDKKEISIPLNNI